MTNRCISPSYQRSRGGIYIVVLGMSMLVTVIALGGLMAARVQSRSATTNLDLSNARLCARAGIEMAMYRMRTLPTWRKDMGNGPWFTNVPIGSGTFTVQAIDPITGDLTQTTKPSCRSDFNG